MSEMCIPCTSIPFGETEIYLSEQDMKILMSNRSIPISDIKDKVIEEKKHKEVYPVVKYKPFEMVVYKPYPKDTFTVIIIAHRIMSPSQIAEYVYYGLPYLFHLSYLYALSINSNLLSWFFYSNDEEVLGTDIHWV